MNDFSIVALWLANLIGLIQWGILSLLLMEVTICKDARAVNTSRILNKSLSARLRLFKRSFRSAFYRASVGLFIGSMMAMFVMMEKLWNGVLSFEIFPWSIFSLFVPLCIFILYREFGFSLTFFNKLKRFLKGEE